MIIIKPLSLSRNFGADDIYAPQIFGVLFFVPVSVEKLWQ